MKTIFTFVPPEDLKYDLMESFPNVPFSFYSDIHNAEEELQNAEVIVTYGEDLTERHIEMAEQLKWIMVTSAGLEKMPLQAIKDRGILITNARGIHKIPMAEFTIGLMLQYAKQFPIMQEQQKEHLWKKGLPIIELSGQTVLIVGAGSIGSEIARLASAFGMKTIGVNKSGSKTNHFDEMLTLSSIEEGLINADFIINILPSTSATKHFYQKRHFERMKKSAVFINIGRGDAVKTELLMQVMQEELIEHAFLDVFEEEPLPSTHPFWHMNNVTITPHISSNTNLYLPRSFEILKHNLRTYINKQENFINVIDIEKGY
ncbi:D-2-hydroxyacid dehydrogenase [Bacillus sp. FJAT-49736]|uniref:D-2-hydroxyacid dehydrogenase n=1 Tax=Bacillus sp. FJAT-49736 TaxID=2833582 RepID=UPI001BCA1830|nr:D-2-hydroxyacid dehydrogenase [Bacillus sp. FJAT-49736]MBS4175178.1 D-2-hydroxyacid dehydrogenase [Bacillus sp. FJAT-49736]